MKYSWGVQCRAPEIFLLQGFSLWLAVQRAPSFMNFLHSRYSSLLNPHSPAKKANRSERKSGKSEGLRQKSHPIGSYRAIIRIPDAFMD
jgi:hypothetical protein